MSTKKICLNPVPNPLTLVRCNINVILQSLAAVIPSLGVSSLDLTAPNGAVFFRRTVLRVASAEQPGRTPKPSEKTFPELSSGLALLPLSRAENFRRATLTRRPVGSSKKRRSQRDPSRLPRGASSGSIPQARAASLNRLRRQTGSLAQPGRRAIRSPSGESFRRMCQIHRRPRPLMQCPARYETPHQALLPPEPVVAGPSGDGRGVG